ncbi:MULTISPECIES: efflux RND transporter periplasmic adaptor subunit [Porphyromonadaceae]|uniref:RND transporter n=1 Tax=Sanguibacteroides justesenii TaxID=1547597 RepID=A0A0C3RDP7_9PORP|nr:MULTISPECIES: efflux RND transporter periplasmic adaptor subunit [Porphyromonadaceae]KIO44411.1 RND transporter [Sanguibacteroides justesenii]KIO45333.1 RND transporter [Sanguibacteroides justesenii]PXZ44619.1 efflux RND transporter periplasmic adaptor subunit [Sanguibacteroides justesenii]
MVKNLILSIIALAILTGCSNKKDKAADTSNATVQAVPVKVMKLEKKKIAKTIDYTANLEAEEQVYYAPSSTGRIEKIHVEVGDPIKKGQLLVEMDRTQLHQAEVQLKNLETEYNRAVMLKKTESISQQAYDAAVTQYEVAKSNVEFLRENTKLLAPFNGVVTGKFYENGEMYSGSPAGGAAKASVISIEQINPLKAKVNMTEQYFPLIKQGTPVELKSAIYPDRTFPGKVSIVYPTIDKDSRTFTVEVKIPNNDLTLRPGMFGSITFFIGETETMVVPALAVLKLQGANNRYVFLNDNGKAKRVEVILGKRFDDQVELISDEIKEGDELITVGQARLVDGAPIQITK